jgi:hypothetical protein
VRGIDFLSIFLEEV